MHEAGYTFDHLWIIASYVLWITAISIGWIILGRHSSRLNKHARQLIADGVEESDELGHEAAAPVASVFGGIQDLILLAFIYLMVVLPGA